MILLLGAMPQVLADEWWSSKTPDRETLLSMPPAFSDPTVALPCSFGSPCPHTGGSEVTRSYHLLNTQI